MKVFLKIILKKNEKFFCEYQRVNSGIKDAFWNIMILKIKLVRNFLQKRLQTMNIISEQVNFLQLKKVSFYKLIYIIMIL